MARFHVSIKETLTIVTYKAGRSEKIDERGIRILSTSLFRGCFRVKRDDERKFTYTAPRAFPIKDYLQVRLADRDFYEAIVQILDVIQKIEESGLKKSNIVMDLNHVFVNPKTKELFFLYRPVVMANREKKIKEYIKELLRYYRRKHAKEQPVCAEFETWLQGAGEDLRELECYIRQNCPQAFARVGNVQGGNSGFITNDRVQFAQHYSPQKAVSTETTMLNEGDDSTTLLGAAPEDVPKTTRPIRICRVRTGETCVVLKNEFRIGKAESNDLIIRDNTTISREHVAIRCNNGINVLVDLNSTNHTFLNGRMLIPGQEELIGGGDIMRLSDEEFRIEE